MGIEITIDGKEIRAREGETILAAALRSGLYIPHLCYHPDLPSFKEVSPLEVCYRGSGTYRTDSLGNNYGGCGLCLVEISGMEEPTLSCDTRVQNGMVVLASTGRINAIRQEKLASVLADHPHACLTCAQKEGCSLAQCSSNVPENERCCPQFDFCELRKVVEFVGIDEETRSYVFLDLYTEEGEPLFLRDYNLCIGCLRCVRVCREVIGAKALGFVVSDGKVIAGTTHSSLEASGCRFCGACVEVCPTGALRDKELRAGDRRAALIPCAGSCPAGMDVPSYVRSIAQGNYRKAAEIINESLPLASILGYICHHPCEDECRRGKLNGSVAICDLKRFALQMTKPLQLGRSEAKTIKRVAVLGSGPAGLVAAYFLAKLGHSVTVYETQAEPGGMLRWAIPEYRLPRSVVEREMEDIRAMGVEILTNTPISKETFLERFNRKEWDAVFLASGAQESKKIEVEGLGLDGVYWGLEFLKGVRQGKIIEPGERVVVIGGGNVALDVAMTALRLGATRVELACLEKREEMPAFRWEIQEAETEGILIHPGWGLGRIKGDGNRVKGVELLGCTSVFDEEGNFSPSLDTSKKKSLEAEAVILSIGQRADISFIPSGIGMQLTGQGTVRINPETLETSVRGIFAGGEVVSGPSSAVEAMAMGKRAADSIDRFLGGKGITDSSAPSRGGERPRLWMGREEGFVSRERIPAPSIPLPERLQSFDIIQLGYGEDEARREAGRCLQCDLRFRLSPVTLPPKKWLEFSQEAVDEVPASGGAFQLLDEKKNIIYIAGTPDLRLSLQERLQTDRNVRYFGYEEDPMYTKRESVLIQQYLQRHGHLPPGNEEVEDLF